MDELKKLYVRACKSYAVTRVLDSDNSVIVLWVQLKCHKVAKDVSMVPAMASPSLPAIASSPQSIWTPYFCLLVYQAVQCQCIIFQQVQISMDLQSSKNYCGENIFSEHGCFLELVNFQCSTPVKVDRTHICVITMGRAGHRIHTRLIIHQSSVYLPLMWLTSVSC